MSQFCKGLDNTEEYNVISMGEHYSTKGKVRAGTMGCLILRRNTYYPYRIMWKDKSISYFCEPHRNMFFKILE